MSMRLTPVRKKRKFDYLNRMNCKYKKDTPCTDDCHQSRCVFRYEKMFYKTGETSCMKPHRLRGKNKKNGKANKNH